MNKRQRLLITTVATWVVATLPFVYGQDGDALAILPFEEGTGLVTADASGGGNAGTLQSGATFENNTGDGSSYSIRLDGVNDLVLLDPLDASGSGLTLACWFRADTFPGDNSDPRLISKATGTSGKDHIFMLSTIRAGSDTRLRGRIRIGGTTTTVISESGNLASSRWYHAVLTYDGIAAKLYLDGVEVGSVPLSGAIENDSSVPVAVGAQPPGAGDRFFDGLIDDVRILQRALRPEEISAIIEGNAVPAAGADDYETNEDERLSVGVASGVLANDTDGDLDALAAVLDEDVTSGALSLNADGSFTYDPGEDFNGEDRFTYRATDGRAQSDVATVTITVRPANDPPQATADSYETMEGTTLMVDAPAGVLANDADTDDDPLQAFLEGDVSDGVLALNADGSFEYTPRPGFHGQDSFTYRATDGVLNSGIATVVITVAEVNKPPTAGDDSYAIQEDTVLSVDAAGGVLANDTDDDFDSLQVEVVDGVAHGTLELDPDGSFIYTPNRDFNGSDEFTYVANDSEAYSNIAAVTLVVGAVNDPPVAVGDFYVTDSDTVLSVGEALGVLANDSDVESQPLTAALVNGVENGSLTLNPDGSFNYSPAPEFAGQDSFSYIASDGGADSNPAIVVIEVENTEDSDALVILPLDEESGTVAEDISGMNNDGTLSGGASFEPESGDGSRSSVRFDGVNDSIALGTIDVLGSGFTMACWFKADSFPGPSNDPRLISKATGTSGREHVFMLSTIREGPNVRLRARIRINGATTTLIGESGNLVGGAWYHAAATYDGQNLRLFLDSVQVASIPLSGTIDVDPAVPVAVGSQPPGAGERFFDGLIDDVRILQRALTGFELMSIVAGNMAPVATMDSYQTAEGEILSVSAADGVLVNDTDGDLDTLQAVLVGDVGHGNLTLVPDGSFTYAPLPDFSGLDSFTYRASDGISESNLATVTLNVEPVNDIPVAVDDSYQMTEGEGLSVTAVGGVLANDTDVDEDGLEAVLVDDVDHGTLALAADGSFTYTPDPDFNGEDSFRYRASDGVAPSNTATVTINVSAGNDPPVAAGESYAGVEDEELSVTAASGVLANDTDVDQDGLEAVLVDDVDNGALALGADGSFTYTPDPNFNGADSFRYRASDGVAQSNTATVTINVSAANDPPIAVGESYAAAEDEELSVTAAGGVLANDSDVDQDGLEAVLVDDVSNGTLTLAADGSFTYTPDPDFNGGEDSFRYRASDGSAYSDVVTVSLMIGGLNQPPSIVTGEVVFSKQVIHEEADETHAVVAADLDDDGLPDMVATDFVDDTVFWYKNDGLGGFEVNVIDTALYGAYPCSVADVDLDGDVDVLASGYEADTHVWYENDGGGLFTRHDVDTAAIGAHSIVGSDLDQDGDVDLLTSGQDGNTVAWYENDGLQNFALRVIDDNAVAAKRAEVGDLDRDGDLDVIAASFSGEVAWYENDGVQNFSKRIIDTSAAGAYYVSPADVEGDGDLDIFAVSQLDDTVSWYANDGAGSFSKNIITTTADAVRMVIASDIDGDGDVDALVASREDDTIAWYSNNGAGQFTKQVVDANAPGAYGVMGVDIDGDADIDVLGALRNANQVVVYTHSKVHVASVDVADTRVIDGSVLRTLDPDDGPSELIYRVSGLPIFGELRLDGVALGLDDVFTQDDVDNNRFSYSHSGTASAQDGFVLEVADGGEAGVLPVATSFRINITGGTEELIVHLPADEGSGIVVNDISGLGNHGTLVNGAGFSGSTGDGTPSSMRFDGINDYLELGALDVSGSGLTLAAWFNADSFPGNSNDPRLISKAIGPAADDHIFMLSTIAVGSQVRLRARMKIGNSTTTLIATTGNLSSGAWRHAAATFDGVTMRLYLDAVEVGNTSVPGSVAVDPSMPVTVGAQPPGAGGKHFDGMLDDIRIYQSALSQPDLEAIVHSAPPQPLRTRSDLAGKVEMTSGGEGEAPSATRATLGRASEANSVRRAPEITILGKNSLSLTFRHSLQGSVGVDYIVEMSKTLLGGDWVPIDVANLAVKTESAAEDVVSAVVEFDDALPPRAFFRIRAQSREFMGIPKVEETANYSDFQK